MTTPPPKPLRYGQQWLDEEDAASVLEALRSDWLTQGPLIARFEQEVARWCGARFGAAFSSGTAALHAACFAAGVREGDEVITTPLTFVATANAAVYLGARPVFADIEPETLNVDPKQIRRRLTPKTKVILPVHFAGLPCRMEAIQEIARARGLRVIEDACHALGAQWKTSDGRWERVGSCSHSDMAVLSFHPVKHITTGEGGMVLFNREEFLEPLRSFRHHGMVRCSGEEGQAEPWGSRMQELGYNFRITDLQCALGISQLTKLERFLKRRREIAREYKGAFEALGLWSQPQEAADDGHAWHLFVVQLPAGRPSAERRRIFEALRQEGIGVNVHYLPVHLQPYYRRRFSGKPGDYPVTEAYYERALTLPLFPGMTDAEVHRVIDAVRRVMTGPPAAVPAAGVQGGSEWARSL
jgi:UDP-4-amino-4,6-dideoxy-N-acetyl-beta-L-altrosamine transaminase